jgi:hypothetical protein
MLYERLCNLSLHEFCRVIGVLEDEDSSEPGTARLPLVDFDILFVWVEIEIYRKEN